MKTYSGWIGDADTDAVAHAGTGLLPGAATFRAFSLLWAGLGEIEGDAGSGLVGLYLWATFGDGEFEYRGFAGFGMEFEFEAVFEEGLEGEGKVIAGHIFDAGGDVVVFGVEPGGAAKYLVCFDFVGDVDKLAHRHVVGFEAARSDVNIAIVSTTGCAEVDCGYFDLRATGWNLSVHLQRDG